MALDQQYRKMLRDLMLESDSLSGRQTLSDGSIIGYDANTPEDMIASVANPPQPMLEIQQQQVEQPQTPQRISDLLVRQRPQDFGDQQRFDEAYQFKQQMPEGQSYLRNNTTGAVQTLPSGQRQAAASPSNAFNDLILFGQMNSIDPATIGKLIKYQSSAQTGMPSAIDLYTASFKYNKPIDEMLGYYGMAASGQAAQNAAQMQSEKDRLGLEKTRAELAQLGGKGLSPEEKAYQEARGKNRAEAEASRMPGTKQYLADQEERTRANKLQSIIQENAETALESINRAKPKIGYFSTGLPGQILSNVGGTDAKDLEEALRPIRALIGFDKLQELREMSKTGGALGQVAVDELKFLQSVKGSLDTVQSEAQLRDILNSVENYYKGKRGGITATNNNKDVRGAPVPIRSEAEANNLPRGTVVIINGRRAVVE